MITNSLVGNTSPPPRRPGNSPDRSVSLRERIFGDRSIVVIVILLVGLMASLAMAIRPGADVWRAVEIATYFAAALIVSSQDARLRAASFGIFAISVCLFASFHPALAIGFGTLMAVAQFANSRVLSVLESLAPLRTRAELLPLIRRSLALQATEAMMIIVPTAVVTHDYLAGRFVPEGSMPLLLVVGIGVCGYAMYRRLRDFSDSFVGRRGVA